MARYSPAKRGKCRFESDQSLLAVLRRLCYSRTMNEYFGDIWTTDCDLRVITTNGDVNRFGEAVMGRGVAKQAKAIFPGVERKLGEYLKQYGNRVFRLYSHLASFPVKHHWGDSADLALIERSAHQLVALVDKFHYYKIILPRPGCGNGNLEWDDVKPVIAPILDSRFTVVDKNYEGL